MSTQVNPMIIERILNPSTRAAARSLGELLSQMPEYVNFLELIKAVNKDQTVQNLTMHMRTHQNALQWGNDVDGLHASELARLEFEFEDLQIVQEYRQSEKFIRALFCSIDELISQEAGLAFAENAKRSGCCG